MTNRDINRVEALYFQYQLDTLANIELERLLSAEVPVLIAKIRRLRVAIENHRKPCLPDTSMWPKRDQELWDALDK